MFAMIWQKIKEMIRKMLPTKTIESVIGSQCAISSRMSDAIDLWSTMYEGNSPWLREPTMDNPVRIVSLGLPALIASEKARMVTLEMESEINAPMAEIEEENPDYVPPSIGEDGVVSMGRGSKTVKKEVPTGPTERADFLNTQYKKLKRQIRRQLEYGIAKGGLVIKPYIVVYNDAPSSKTDTSTTITDDNTKKDDSQMRPEASGSRQNDITQSSANNSSTDTEKAPDSSNTSSHDTPHYNDPLPRYEIEFDFIQADRFFPLSFDANGKVTEAAFIQTKADKDKVFIRLEYHVLNGRTVTVQNMAFESTDMSLVNTNNIRSASNLGRSIPLTDVPEWANFQPTTTIEDVDRLLFAYFRMPEANTIDPYSPLGVSGFSRAVKLIKDADMQYSRLLWEYEGGELAIDVDRDALKLVVGTDDKYHTVLSKTQERLFRKIDLNAEDTYKVFNPQLRDESLIRGLNTILTRIEDVTGLSRGTISDITTQDAKTATELKILKQRSYATNADIQMALQSALEDAIYVMDVYCSLYNVTPPGEYETSYEWDDSIIVDSESELSKRITLMNNGLASKLETRMWYFGETEPQAKAALQKIDDESKQSMEQNIEVQKQLGAEAQTTTKDGEPAADKKGISDKTQKKISTGQQADNLDNPLKTQASKDLKNSKK